MLQPFIHVLNAKKIVLASSSPRRRIILENIGLRFEVIPSTFEENLDKSLYPHPSDYVKETARLKALDVAEKLSASSGLPDLLISADTVVTMDEKIYEKPKDYADAVSMLKSFSGRSHIVYTGVVLVSPLQSTAITSGEVLNNLRLNIFHEGTEVQMSEMTNEVIKSYVDTGEPMDKAGGYGIQAVGGTLVEGVKGDYFNVMGFPLHRFAKMLSQLYTL